MKTKLFTLFVLLLLCTYPQLIFAQNAEEEAIKKVLLAETQTYFKAQAEAWQALWTHDATTNRAGAGNGGVGSVMGWENFGPQTASWLKDSAKPVNLDIKNDGYVIKTNGNLAWVEYNQQITGTSAADSSYNGSSREYRLLVKDNNEWKINSLITHQENSSSPQAIENTLNTTGYNLLASKKVDDAIDVFLLNVKLFPNSWNTYDSLGEAYAAAGNKELAIKNYERSIEMNPQNDNGKKMLEKLKQ
ncbi:MAG TPA: tetratricopeptide repeat protein [Chitinophagaceae bacterium]|jgi:tetratricopeptide (TPR) repeat protein